MFWHCLSSRINWKYYWKNISYGKEVSKHIIDTRSETEFPSVEDPLVVHIITLNEKNIYQRFHIQFMRKMLSFRVHSNQGKSGNQGIIREFTKWVFFWKNQRIVREFEFKSGKSWKFGTLSSLDFFYYNFQTLLFSLSLLLSNK